MTCGFYKPGEQCDICLANDFFAGLNLLLTDQLPTRASNPEPYWPAGYNSGSNTYATPDLHPANISHSANPPGQALQHHDASSMTTTSGKEDSHYASSAPSSLSSTPPNSAGSPDLPFGFGPRVMKEDDSASSRPVTPPNATRPAATRKCPEIPGVRKKAMHQTEGRKRHYDKNCSESCKVISKRIKTLGLFKEIKVPNGARRSLPALKRFLEQYGNQLGMMCDDRGQLV